MTTQTIGDKLIERMHKIVSETFVIPNSMLPDHLHEKVRGGRTIAKLHKMMDQVDGITEHVKLKELKARNIERLAAQVLNGELDREFDYSQNETDEIALHRAECALISGMVSGGLIDADDLKGDFDEC